MKIQIINRIGNALAQASYKYYGKPLLCNPWDPSMAKDNSGIEEPSASHIKKLLGSIKICSKLPEVIGVPCIIAKKLVILHYKIIKRSKILPDPLLH